MDVKIHSHRRLCNFGSRTPVWSFPNEFYVSRLNIISKRHSKDLAIVVTRRGSCLSARDCCGVCCWLSVTYAVFNRPLSQWLCRREGTFNHPPIIWELMCHTHTLDGSFVFFFTQDCSAFFHLMSDFCCVVFCRPSLLVFSVVSKSLLRCQFRFLIDFICDSFHL